MVENQGYQVGGVNDLAEWFPADETQWGKKKVATNPWVNKREAFIDKAENRTNNAVRYIRSIANLSSVRNQQRYVWTEQDVKDIFKFIESEVRLAKKKMMLNDGLPRPFKLD